jgi:transglutaminase-like putative cysteine protease
MCAPGRFPVTTSLEQPKRGVLEKLLGRKRDQSILIRAGYEIALECAAPTAVVLTLNVHPDRRSDLKSQDTLENDRNAAMNQYVDGFGNICTRIVLPQGVTTFRSTFEIADTGLPDPVVPHARLTAIQDLPDEVMVYLLGSRYCETDRMSELAWSLFGTTEPGWARVQAIVDYTHERLEFGYHHARVTRTAWEAHEERIGVCRDFAHLAVTLCRCMSVPARYCTGYLGDIGVPKDPAPMDFSAWFEAFLDGEWRTFDARHNVPRIGRVLIARGRDATDTAITTSYGATVLKTFKVVTDLA